MSKHIKQEGYIVWRKYPYEPKANYVFLDYKPADSLEVVVVMPHTLEIELPATFDPTGAQVSALEAMKAEALEKYQETVANINRQLSMLQAITYESETK